MTWDLETLKPVSQLPTIGGHAYGLDVSPHDGGSVAIACGDSLVRIWHTDVTTAYDCEALWKGFQCRVHCVAWHPEEDGMLAYGLDDGSVGVYDVTKDKNVASKVKHPQTAKAVQWGPSAAGPGDLQLYSCSDAGTLTVQCNPAHANPPKPTDVIGLLAQSRPSGLATAKATTFRWSQPGDEEAPRIAVGKQDGTVEIGSQSLQHLEVLYGHRRAVTCVAWQRGTAALLAVGSEDGNIYVYDMAHSGAGGGAGPAGSPTAQPRGDPVKLTLHTGQITAVDWSPHNPKLLLSTSSDASAQIWDATTRTALANFRGHIGKILAGRWSDLHPDQVFTGSADQSVLAWSWKELVHTRPPPVERRAKSKGGNKGGTAAQTAPQSNNVAPPAENKAATAPVTRKDGGGGSSTAKKDRKPKSMLPFCGSLKQLPVDKSQEHCHRLLDRLDGALPPQADGGETGGNDDLDIGLHLSRKHAVATVRHESKRHREAGQMTMHGTLCLWEGRLLDALENACRERKLTEALVAMSPQAGHDVWLQVTQIYAEQLLATGDVHGAATQFLLGGNGVKAVDVYKEAGLFSEAVALAKLRLAPSDPVFCELYTGWAAQAEKQSCFELAAKCHIANGDGALAVHVLARRGGQRGLQCAHDVARRLGVVMVDLAPRLVLECRANEDWAAALAVVTTTPALAHHVPALEVEATLHRQLLTAAPFADAAASALPDLAMESAAVQWMARYEATDGTAPAATSPLAATIKACVASRAAVAATTRDIDAPPPGTRAETATGLALSCYGQGTEDACLVAIAASLCAMSDQIIDPGEHTGEIVQTALSAWRRALALAHEGGHYSLLCFLARTLFPAGVVSLDYLLGGGYLPIGESGTADDVALNAEAQGIDRYLCFAALYDSHLALISVGCAGTLRKADSFVDRGDHTYTTRVLAEAKPPLTGSAGAGRDGGDNGELSGAATVARVVSRLPIEVIRRVAPMLISVGPDTAGVTSPAPDPAICATLMLEHLDYHYGAENDAASQSDAANGGSGVAAVAAVATAAAASPHPIYEDVRREVTELVVSILG